MNLRRTLNEMNTNAPDVLRVDSIMKEGDFIVYYDRGVGFVMYHRCDGLTWRTASDSMKNMKADNAELVEGIYKQDIKMPVVKTGSNFGE